MDAKTRRRKDENWLSHVVLGAALEVHRALGPGLLEVIYERCLCIELARRAVAFERQCRVPVVYRGQVVGFDYRLDLLVEGVLVVELKATEAQSRLHAAQVLTYLKLTGCRLGLVINFGQRAPKDGIERVVNGLS